MNTDKLVALLDRHGERSTAYRHLAARYRQAVKDVARQQAELTAEADDLAADVADGRFAQLLPQLDGLEHSPFDVLAE